jgi:hypothetical protein
MRNLYDLTCILAKQVLSQLSYTPRNGCFIHFLSLGLSLQPLTPEVYRSLHFRTGPERPSACTLVVSRLWI